MATLAACRDGTVRVTFRPEEGARAVYRVTVAAQAVTTIAGRPERQTDEKDVFTAEHTVLAATRGGTRVEVRLSVEGREPQTFVVRVDRAGQLAEVQRIEGFPADVLGGLGLSEVFPAAATAPPNRPLAPGDRWTIDTPTDEPGAGRIRGTGRLTVLGTTGGRAQATVESDYVLPVERTTEQGGQRLRLEGEQRTRVASTHSLRDGAVEKARAETTGTFRLLLLPPPGTDAPGVPGRLVVRVRSTTVRLR